MDELGLYQALLTKEGERISFSQAKEKISNRTLTADQILAICYFGDSRFTPLLLIEGTIRETDQDNATLAPFNQEKLYSLSEEEFLTFLTSLFPLLTQA